MFLAETRNKNKTVFDWDELEAAVTERRRLKRATPISDQALSRAMMRFSPDSYVAQLHERLIAVGRQDHIELLWLHHAPGASADDCKLESGDAFVYPAAGGRTQYKVCQSARGHFMNRFLPFNAKDRETKSQYRQWKWAWGGGNMYREGMGPALMECGIAALDRPPADLLWVVAAAGAWVSDEWRSLATRLLESFDGWRDTFADIRFKFEHYGVKEQAGGHGYTLSLRTMRGEHVCASDLVVSHHLTVRLRRPCEEESGRFHAVDDLAICVIPQPELLGFGPKAMYALVRKPVSSNGTTTWDNGEAPARLLTTSMTDVMSAAREFCAAGLFIPSM
jgi:hypothetical protein